MAIAVQTNKHDLKIGVHGLISNVNLHYCGILTNPEYMQGWPHFRGEFSIIADVLTLAMVVLPDGVISDDEIGLRSEVTRGVDPSK